MPIRARCTVCRKSVSAPDAYAGKRAKCPGCGGTIFFPPALKKPVNPLVTTRGSLASGGQGSDQVTKSLDDNFASQSIERVLGGWRIRGLLVAAGLSVFAFALVLLPSVLDSSREGTPSSTSEQPNSTIRDANNKSENADNSQEPNRTQELEPLTLPTAEDTTAAPENNAGERPVTEVNSPKAPEVMPQDFLAETEKSVVTILANTSDGFINTGSGFIVDDNGTIVTNYHVIEGANKVLIVFSSGQKVTAEGWLTYSAAKDLALLKVQVPPVLKPLPLSTSVPQKADTVYTVGTSLGEFGGSVSSGIVSGIRSGATTAPYLEPSLVIIQTTAPISSGNSGGPLLDSIGNVIAVTVGSRPQGQNLNFAISSKHVVELLGEKSRLPLHWEQLPPPQPRPSDAVENAEEERRQQKEQLAIIAADRVARGIRDAQATEADSRAKQGKLNRINEAITDLEQRIAIIEVEGTALTQRRGEIMAEAEGIVIEGRRLENQFTVLRGQIAQSVWETQILIRRDDGSTERIYLLQRQTQTLEAELAAIEVRHAQLESRLVSIDRQARDLLGQIEYKADQRDGLEEERLLLVLQGKIVSEGVKKFLDRIFARWDMDGDGALTPWEAPDQYDVIMNAANLDGDDKVFKSELEKMLTGFGDSPK